MKQLFFLGLLTFSLQVFAETYSCVSKEGGQIVLTREGNQFVQRVKPDTKFTYKIVYEDKWFIRLSAETVDDGIVMNRQTRTVHIDKKKQTLSESTLIGTEFEYSITNLECIVIP